MFKKPVLLPPASMLAAAQGQGNSSRLHSCLLPHLPGDPRAVKRAGGSGALSAGQAWKIEKRESNRLAELIEKMYIAMAL
jgi:hypothetical protein